VYIDGSNGWTAGYYTIVGVNDTEATLDRAATTNSNTGGHFFGTLATSRISISHNLIEDVSDSYYSAACMFSTVGYRTGALQHVHVDNNLIVANGSMRRMLLLDTSPQGEASAVDGLVFRNNIAFTGDQGVHAEAGGGFSSWVTQFNAYAEGRTCSKNVFVIRTTDADYATAQTYFNNGGDNLTPWASNPTYVDSNNYGPRGIANVGFTTAPAETVADPADYDAANYVLASGPYVNAGTDGHDLGPDWTALNAATLHTKDGDWS
jgi:hypothetical protein